MATEKQEFMKDHHMYLIKVRDADIFLKYCIPKYVEESRYFHFNEHIRDVIKNHKLPVDNCIIYKYNTDDTVKCLGIDDGFEEYHNERTRLFNKRHNIGGINMTKVTNRVEVNGYDVEFANFPNGETNLTKDVYTEILERIKAESIEVKFRYIEDADIVRLLLVSQFIAENTSSMKPKKLIIKFMPYSRMDRSQNGCPFSLSYISRILRMLPFEDIVIWEAHSAESISQLKNKYVRVTNRPVTIEILQYLKENNLIDDNIVIALPDAGATARYSEFLDKNDYEFITGVKNRDFDTGRIDSVTFPLGYDLKGKRVLIIDDMSSYGGTFNKAVKGLKVLGAETVDLVIAHAENSIFKGELFDHVNHIYTTDSILTEDRYPHNLKFANQLTVLKESDIPQLNYSYPIL